MTHTCEKHQPGSYSCYQRHRCRCAPCLAEATRHRKRAALARLRGIPHRVPAEPARIHVTRLLAAGMGRAEVARLADIDVVTIPRLLRGDCATLRADRAARLLAVTVTPVTDQKAGLVNGVGARRRLEALATLGWSTAEVLRRSGLGMHSAETLIRTGRCFCATRAAIAATYDDLWCTTAPVTSASAKTIHRALRHGWARPMQWDDGVGPHGIDNPAATPYVTRQREVRKDTAAEILWLARVGTPAADLAKRVGVTEEAVAKALKKAGRTDLWEAIRDRRDLFQDHTAAVRARLTKGRAA